MTYRIIDKTTKMFLRDDTVFNKETEQAIMSVNAPQYGIYSKYMGSDTEQYHCIWTDTRTTEDLAKIEKDKQRAIEIQNAIAYLNDTKYICDNYSDCIYNEDKIKYLAEISDTYKISNSDILKKRREMRQELNRLKHES